MKKYVLCVVGICTCFLSYAQFSEETPFISKSFPDKTIKQVQVQNFFGSISVSTMQGKEPKVDIFVQVRKNGKNYTKEAIRKILEENYDLDIAVNDNKLSVTVKKRQVASESTPALQISVNLRVPEENISAYLTATKHATSLASLSGTISID